MITVDGYRILYLDASSFKDSACLEKLRYIISEGLREDKNDSALVYGTSVHKFIAELRISNGDFPKALAIANTIYAPYSFTLKDKDFRTLIHFSNTCKGYYEKVFKGDDFLPIKKDGVSQIEQKFAFPATDIFPELKDILETNKLVIILCGTVDEIGVIDGNNITIKDIKTTTSWNIYEYMDTYRLSTQMLFYVVIVEHLLRIKNVGVMIDVIALSATKETEFARSDVMYYSEEKRNSFISQLRNTVRGIAEAFSNNPNHWPQNYTLCDCSKFQSDTVGKCPFFKLCKAEDEDIKASYKKSYKQINYEPLRFDEQK